VGLFFDACSRFDNSDVAVDDPSVTEYAYNGANELLRMTEDGMPTAFRYDGKEMSLDRPMGIGLSGEAGHASMAGQHSRGGLCVLHA
jgi:hypothetical protein